MTWTDDVSEQQEDPVADDASSPTDVYVERRIEDSSKNRMKMARIRDNRKIDPKRIKSEKRKGRGRDHSRDEWD